MNTRYETWEISEQQIKDVCKGVFEIFREDPFFKEELLYWEIQISGCLNTYETKEDHFLEKVEVMSAVCSVLNAAEKNPAAEARKIYELMLSLHPEPEAPTYHRAMFGIAYFRYLEKHPERRASGVDQSEKNKKNYIVQLRDCGLITLAPHKNPEGKLYCYYPTEYFVPDKIRNCLGVSTIPWRTIAEFKLIVEHNTAEPKPMDADALRILAEKKKRKKSNSK